MTIKNIMVTSDEENVMYHVLTLTCEEVKAFAEKVLGVEVNDYYEVADEELQWFCIDSRVWLTREQEAVLRKKIA